MITYVTGSLFESPAQVLVNTVNTVGVMGKGVAYQFKRLFPEMFEQYRALCESGQLRVGKLWLYKTPNKWILNFPTKIHWRNPSRLEYIEAGLRAFVYSYTTMGVHSIAFPPLGCGNGQLDFATQVQPIMEKYLRNLPIEVFIHPDRDDPFEPEHTVPEEMREWLRSEPASLPFAEVWDDLVDVVTRRSEFSTQTGTSTFAVRAVADPPHLLIETAGGNRVTVPYEALQAFWQQIRTHGYTTRKIAPDMTRQLSYLIPVFAELHYVRLVNLSDSYEKLTQNPSIGLQIRPNASSNSESRVQLSLFELV
ncbi:MAG: macro domain-containing protein [Chloroflexi bacterium]|nr:macro domain-containing protein [Chloroflexota bacterium]